MGIRILLVDDEERFLETMSKLLTRRGVVTFTASGGKAALELLDQEPIDVAIVDIKMPGMDGLELLRKLRQRYPQTEVILLTGHVSVESAVEGMKLGAFDYLIKPCGVEELLSKARAAVEMKEKRKAATRAGSGQGEK